MDKRKTMERPWMPKAWKKLGEAKKKQYADDPELKKRVHKAMMEGQKKWRKRVNLALEAQDNAEAELKAD